MVAKIPDPGTVSASERRWALLRLALGTGMVGAVVGGWLFKTFGKMAHAHPVPGVTGLNLESVFVAVVGAVVLLIVYHAIRRR